MSDKHLEPARTVIAKAGGVEAVARITGKHVSRIYRWMHPREKGGTGGVVPHADATKLLKEAQSDEKIDLRPEDFFVTDCSEAPAEAVAS